MPLVGRAVAAFELGLAAKHPIHMPEMAQNDWKNDQYAHTGEIRDPGSISRLNGVNCCATLHEYED